MFRPFSSFSPVSSNNCCPTFSCSMIIIPVQHCEHTQLHKWRFANNVGRPTRTYASTMTSTVRRRYISKKTNRTAIFVDINVIVEGVGTVTDKWRSGNRAVTYQLTKTVLANQIRLAVMRKSY